MKKLLSLIVLAVLMSCEKEPNIKDICWECTTIRADHIGTPVVMVYCGIDSTEVKLLEEDILYEVVTGDGYSAVIYKTTCAIRKK